MCFVAMFEPETAVFNAFVLRMSAQLEQMKIANDYRCCGNNPPYKETDFLEINLDLLGETKKYVDILKEKIEKAKQVEHISRPKMSKKIEFENEL